MQTLAEFVSARLGQVVGDTPENRGQCVGLVELWLDNLGKPHIWGNAAQLLQNAPVASYSVIANAPANYPIAGDIVVWGSSWGGGFGHTAVVIWATDMLLVVLEQNNPDGASVRVVTHDYSGVIGWLRPR